ncbi:unnamed protein product [Penicillium pancosmium]
MLLEIAFSIDSENDLASFVQVNRAMYQTLISQLYRGNAKDSDGSAIRHAAVSDNCSTLRRALQAWKDINGSTNLPKSPDSTKSTPLFAAAYRGNVAAVKMLLNYGVSPNARDKSKRTPLYVASGRGHTVVVKTLLEHPRIKVNAYNNDRIRYVLLHVKVILKSAIRNQQPELARLLVNREDVDPNALGEDSTPLRLAVRANRGDLVEILLTDKRVDPDLNVCLRSGTPLLAAALKNNEAMVHMLLSAGADKEIKDATGLSPAMLFDAASAEARYQLIRDHPTIGLNLLMQSSLPLPSE